MLPNTNFDTNSHHELGFKRPQMTSIDLAKPETKTKCNKRNKNVLKPGSIQGNVWIND